MKTKNFLRFLLNYFRAFADGQDFDKINGLYDQEQNSNTNRILIVFSNLLHSMHLLFNTLTHSILHMLKAK